MNKIEHFGGEYRFLSNFYPVEVKLDGMIYPSVEHAYQAAKSLNPAQRRIIQQTKTAGEAKKIGRIVVMRKDWDSVKLRVMGDLLVQKFRHPELAEKLLATGDTELVEGNYWGDTFWGTCKGVGHNHLGKLLMRIRDNLRKTL